MEFSAGKIAELVEGQVDGDSEICISMVAKIEEGSPGTLTFLANPKYEPYIYSTGSSIALVESTFSPTSALPKTLTLIRVKDPYLAFAKLLNFYKNKNLKTGISKHAAIEESAEIGSDVYIGPFVVIGENSKVKNGARIYSNTTLGNNVVIGENSVINSGCNINDDCHIGANCELHSGVVIGADGFGFAPNAENNYNKVAQIGNVIIEDNVEIGANTAIDRATLGSTRICKGVKLDNLIQIAHNVEIGENTVIAAQTGIAGSTKIGKNCLIGGQVGIIGHLTIADGVMIAAQSGIGASIEEKGAIMQGSPAIPNRDFKRSFIGFMKLPELRNKISQLEKELKALKSQV